MTEKICSADGCERSAARADNGKRGMCSMHYQRFKKHGDTTTVKTAPSPAKDWLRDHVDHQGTDCLIWPFATDKNGYGVVHRPGDGPLTTAANLMCEWAHGPAPSKRHETAHSCGNGNTGCVNPRHLYWATPEQNQADRVMHGTSNRGEQQWMSKLTAADVRKIRALAESVPQGELAEQFGVDQSTISKIVHRRQWAWLA